MGRKFISRRKLHGFRTAKSNIMIPTIMISIGSSEHCSYLINKEVALPLSALQICDHMKAEKVIHDLYWVADCGTSEETAVRCSVVINRRVADVYTLLGALAAIITLCGLEEVGGGNLNTQNNMYSAVYTNLIQSYRSNSAIREIVSDTFHRLSMEAG